MIILRSKLFSEKEVHKVRLSDVKSHRGLGRSYFVGSLPGAVGGYKGKKLADKLDEEGLSDEEILEQSKKKASRTGAAVGGAIGAASGISNGYLVGRRIGGKKGAAIGTAVGAGIAATSAGLGALGGRLGASKNTRTRLEKRRKLEENLRD